MTMDWFDFPVVSPDGQRLILPGKASDGVRHLWVRSLDSLTDQLLPGTEGAILPFWSPDSRSIGFTDGDRLKSIDAAGGLPVTLCDVGIFAGGDWNRDGVILFSVGEALLRLPAAGGEPKPVLPLDKSRQEEGQMAPRFLPDGRHFLYLSRSAGTGKSGLYLGSLDSKETRMLLPTESNVNYVSPGFLIYGRQETLLAQPFDSGKFRFTGEAVPIAEHVGRMEAVPVSQFSASQNGVLVYGSSGISRVQLAWYNRQGARQAPVGDPGVYAEARLSPDEKRLVVTRTNSETGISDLWIQELSTGILSRLTSHRSEDAQWSPDGRELMFSSRQKGHLDLYRKAIGAGNEELVFESDEDKWVSQWLKDNSVLVVNPSGKIFYRLPLSGQRKPEILLRTEAENNAPVVSSDGRWVAYQSLESGRWEIHLAAFPSFKERRQVSNGGGCQPHWRKDGRELFYLGLDGKMISVDVRAASSIDTGAPRALFQTPLRVDPYQHLWAVTGDGKRFLFGESVGEGSKPITVVLNWTARLSR